MRKMYIVSPCTGTILNELLTVTFYKHAKGFITTEEDLGELALSFWALNKNRHNVDIVNAN